MNIDDNLTQLRNISDNLILRLNENGTEIRVIKQKVIDIKEQIHTLKDEKYYKYSIFIF